MGRKRHDARRGELVAIVDLGSNAVPFLLAKVKRGKGYRVPVEERVRTRVGRQAAGTLPLGAVRATRRYLRNDPPRPRELRALRQAVREQLMEALPPAERGDVMVGLGGTVRTLAAIHRRVNRDDRKDRHGLHLSQ